MNDATASAHWQQRAGFYISLLIIEHFVVC
jgi:hypothetical protein